MEEGRKVDKEADKEVDSDMDKDMLEMVVAVDNEDKGILMVVENIEVDIAVHIPVDTGMVVGKDKVCQAHTPVPVGFGV
jgi:hypothetical protein